MAYAERTASTASYRDPAMPMPVAVAEYHDRVRWGPILSGIVVSLTSQLVLSALGASIGFTTGAATDTSAGIISAGVGLWAIISLFISLTFGGYIMASACGPMNRKTALLNAIILWSTTMALSSWLLSSGVSGMFGVAAANAGNVLNQVQESGGLSLPNASDLPDVSPEEAATYAANAAKASWSFVFGSLLGLVAAMIGASTGARKPRINA